MTHTGRTIEDLFAACYRVQQDNQHDQKQAEILQTEISKTCLAPIPHDITGENATECGRDAVGDTERCSRHQEDV